MDDWGSNMTAEERDLAARKMGGDDNIKVCPHCRHVFDCRHGVEESTIADPGHIVCPSCGECIKCEYRKHWCPTCDKPAIGIISRYGQPDACVECKNPTEIYTDPELWKKRFRRSPTCRR